MESQSQRAPATVNSAVCSSLQVKESKRQFIFDVVNEGGESEKMEMFVSFCEDTIFEMQIAAQISEPEGEPEEDEDEETEEGEEGSAGPDGTGVAAAAGVWAWLAASASRTLRGLSYRSLRRRVRRLRRLTAREAATAVAALLWALVSCAGGAGAGAAAGALRLLWGSLFGGGLVDSAKKVTVTELLAGMPDPTGDEVHGQQPSGPGSDAEGEGVGEGEGDAADGAGDEETAADQAGTGGADRAVAVADGSPFRPEGAGGLGDMGDTTPVEPPTPEGSPILKRKLGVREACKVPGRDSLTETLRESRTERGKQRSKCWGEKHTLWTRENQRPRDQNRGMREGPGLKRYMERVPGHQG